MHRRCCCPPERARAVVLQAVLDFVPECRRGEAALQISSSVGVSGTAVEAGAVGHVVEDGHGEGVGLLEDHAHAFAQLDVEATSGP